VNRAELDAAETIGLTRIQTLRHVTLPHLLQTVFPPLANQFIVSILYTSLGAIIGVEELTGRALNIDSQTFRSLEVFIIVGVLYVALTLVSTVVLYGFGRFVLGVRARIF
jgi:polar amino acid transport system permease protein